MTLFIVSSTPITLLYTYSHLLIILDSLVVRISACHVEGPGSIPGRGEIIFEVLSLSLNLWCQSRKMFKILNVTLDFRLFPCMMNKIAI